MFFVRCWPAQVPNVNLLYAGRCDRSPTGGPTVWTNVVLRPPKPSVVDAAAAWCSLAPMKQGGGELRISSVLQRGEYCLRVTQYYSFTIHKTNMYVLDTSWRH